MHPRWVAMPFGSDMHSNRDLFWSMHCDNTNSFIVILHRWWCALSKRVYLHPDHDMRWTVPHHGDRRWAANPDMRPRGVAMSYRSYLYSDRTLQRLVYCHSTSSTTILHRWGCALSKRVYVHPDHDMRW